MKALTQLTDAEKATLLHELFPEEMSALLNSVIAFGRRMINDANTLNDNWITVLDMRMSVDTTENIINTIARIYDQLASDSVLFGESLFHRSRFIFMSAALQEFMETTLNDKLFKAIELLFDL
jgi:hypothetical protein